MTATVDGCNGGFAALSWVVGTVVSTVDTLEFWSDASNALPVVPAMSAVVPMVTFSTGAAAGKDDAVTSSAGMAPQPKSVNTPATQGFCIYKPKIQDHRVWDSSFAFKEATSKQ